MRKLFSYILAGLLLVGFLVYPAIAEQWGTARVVGNFTADTWTRVYNTTLTSAATSVTISGLDGNTDEEYNLLIRAINNNASAAEYRLRFNNDTGSNYGKQNLRGTSTTADAIRSTGDDNAPLSYRGTIAQNETILTDTLIYAKSGYVRTGINKNTTGISGTTVTALGLNGFVWNNTADNVTSLVIYANQADGLGIGTTIELYKKNAKQ
jgi:hypothetical protein